MNTTVLTISGGLTEHLGTLPVVVDLDDLDDDPDWYLTQTIDKLFHLRALGITNYNGILETLTRFVSQHANTPWAETANSRLTALKEPVVDPRNLNEDALLEYITVRTNTSTNEFAGTARIAVEDISSNTYEWFLDELSEQASGSTLLMDINYTLITTEAEDLLFTVTGDPTEALNI